jgi:hypothetical protein
MAIVRKEYVIEQIKVKKLPYFIVKDGNSIIDVQDDDITPDEAADALTNTLDALDDGIVTVLLSDKSSVDKSRGGRLQNMVYKVRVGNILAGQGNRGGIQNISNYSELTRYQDRIRELELLLAKKDHEFELYKLREEFKGSKDKSVFDHPMAQAAITGLLNAWQKSGVVTTNGTPPINGHDEVQSEKRLSADDKQKLKSAIMRLSALDDNLIEHLMLLADMAENKPETYKMAVNMLKNMN